MIRVAFVSGKLLVSVTSYAGDVAFQPKAWKTQIHHLPLQAITSLNCGADNLFKNDVVYVGTQDTQKTLWNQIWVARASGPDTDLYVEIRFRFRIWIVF